MTCAFAEIAVTLPVASRYTYRVPEHMLVRARIGSRVLVRFGPRKVTGVVVREDVVPPLGIKPVDVTDVLDPVDEPALPRDLVDLCLWVADYYEAPPGEVMRAALPAGSGIGARTVIALTEAGRAIAEGQGAALPAKQRALLAKLLAAELSATGLAKSARPVVAALTAAGLVEEREQRDRARVKLKRERVVQLAVPLADARAEVARAPKRYAVIDALAGGDELAIDALAQRVTGAKPIVRELAKLGLVRVGERERRLDALAGADLPAAPPPVLTGEQAVAVAAITAALAGEPAVVAIAETAAAMAISNRETEIDPNAAGHSSIDERVDGGRGEVAMANASDREIEIDPNVAGNSSIDERVDSGRIEQVVIAEPAVAIAIASARETDTEANAGGHSSIAERVDSGRSEQVAIAEPAVAMNVSDHETEIDSNAAGRSAIAERAADHGRGEQAETAVATANASHLETERATLTEIPIDRRVTEHSPIDDRNGSGAAVATRPAQGAFTPFLLHGVTGSGKTEVYLRVIAEALLRGQTALVLVPEISLTPQLAARFRARFGDRVAILHSGLSDQQRLGEWSRLRRGDARIAVGARSAVFAPLANLGVIVVDEEHDGSFKQDEGVRYHARDVALVRAQRAGAVCVLGSATPSLETAAHAERGHYHRLVLAERPTARPMPDVEIVDLRTYMPDGDAMLSAPLRTAIAATLAAGDQTILFLNRRGFATFVLCRACGHAFRCPHCSVSLTYHRHNDRLSCHYCGYQRRVPETCPSCSSHGTIERKGLGTEKVADAIAEAFPQARVARLDRDVASGAKVEAVLARVARREVDILVGTQMVTKGHDFPGVTLVGVLCADTGLDIPDFRASERTFQLLAQVAGRAGRGDRPGRVLIQTYRPSAPAVVAAAAHDYAQFFASELEARRELGYPPHGRLIAIRIDGPDAHEVAATAQRIAQLAEQLAGAEADRVEVRGPVPAPLERLRARTRWQVWLRSTSRQALRRIARSAIAVDAASAVRVALDVDPISAM